MVEGARSWRSILTKAGIKGLLATFRPSIPTTLTHLLRCPAPLITMSLALLLTWRPPPATVRAQLQLQPGHTRREPHPPRGKNNNQGEKTTINSKCLLPQARLSRQGSSPMMTEQSRKCSNKNSTPFSALKTASGLNLRGQSGLKEGR